MLDRVALPAGLLYILFVTVRFQYKLFPHYEGWFSWADQGWYLMSARAWATGQLAPALHNYTPGYSLMAAPFVWLFPAQPFAIPDFVDFAASLLLFAAIARRLCPARDGWRAASIAAFCMSSLITPVLQRIWIIPWNTTGSAPFLFGALLGTFRLCEKPGWRRAAVLGLLLGVLGGIRPTDAAVLAPCIAIYSAVWLRRETLPHLAALAVSGILGLLIGALPFVCAHLAVHGLTGGAYIAKSAGIGFEWRLLPLRWVMIVLDPRPLLPEGSGLAEGLPWIIPGIAGIAFVTMLARDREPAWWLIAAAIAASWSLYLSYRDLQPYGLWRFHNLHYFKWSFSFLLLAALRLGAAVFEWRQRWRFAAAAAFGVAIAAWQPVGVKTAHSSVLKNPPANTVELDMPLSRVSDAALLPLSGTWKDIYFSDAQLMSLDHSFANTRDFKLLPVPGGALLQPLRQLPGPPLLFYPGDRISFSSRADAVALSERIVFGLPCGILPRRLACRSIY
jgi:hypothetical protein